MYVKQRGIAYAMAVFAEMAVETATVSTEERGSGVRLNFIPREGATPSAA
jgi:hypothetical protein